MINGFISIKRSAVGVALFMVLVFYASGWELNIYRYTKRELEILQQKLQDQPEH